MINFCLEPVYVGGELQREEVFGSKDLARVLPEITQPFHVRKQSDQGFTNKCVLYATMELVENKVYMLTGRWYNTVKPTYDFLWKEMKKRGYAGDSWGSVLNGAIEVLKDERVELVDEVSGDSVFVKIADSFYISKQGEFIKNLKMEIAFGGGVLSGVNTKVSGLDYFGAMKPDYYIKPKSNPQEIAHAIALPSFNNPERPDTIYHSNTWGEDVFDKGVAYIKDEHATKLMSCIGFTIDIL